MEQFGRWCFFLASVFYTRIRPRICSAGGSLSEETGNEETENPSGYCIDSMRGCGVVWCRWLFFELEHRRGGGDFGFVSKLPGSEQ